VEEKKEHFEEWAVIDLFGHQKIAGRVSEQQIGGASFIRVDVPAAGESKPFTKLFGPAAIYSITITDEITAKAAAGCCRPLPMDQFSIRDMIKSAELLPESHEGVTVCFPRTDQHDDFSDYGDC